MTKRVEKQSAFTIVELLVVIVVIGILASISIVGYRSIQQRAKTATYTSALSQWEKLLRITEQTNGSLPSVGVYETCLSAGYPAEGMFAANQCYESATYDISTSTNISTAVQAANGSVPTTVLPTVYTYDNANGNQGWARGLIYRNNGPGTGYIQYYLDQATAKGACIGGDSVEYNNYADGTVRCRRALN